MRSVCLAMLLGIGAAMAADVVLVQPKELATQLAAKGTPPAVFYVGPNLLYRTRHIPGAIYAGPGYRPEGLELLQQAVAKLPRDHAIVLYCGCCPWDHCPNIKPTVELLQKMGFTHVKALYLPTSFAQDWTAQGYAVEAGTPRQ